MPDEPANPPDPTPPPQPAPAPAEPPPPPGALTQADVDRASKSAATKAERDAQSRFDAWLKEQKEAQERAAMDDVTRAKAEADEARADADRIRAEATQERFAAKVERKLSAAGVPEQSMVRAARMVMVGPDASDEEIDADIADIRANSPGVFATPTATDGKPPPVVHPSTPAPAPTGTETEYERGVREAKEKRAYLQSA